VGFPPPFFFVVVCVRPLELVCPVYTTAKSFICPRAARNPIRSNPPPRLWGPPSALFFCGPMGGFPVSVGLLSVRRGSESSFFPLPPFFPPQQRKPTYKPANPDPASELHGITLFVLSPQQASPGRNANFFFFCAKEKKKKKRPPPRFIQYPRCAPPFQRGLPRQKTICPHRAEQRLFFWPPCTGRFPLVFYHNFAPGGFGPGVPPCQFCGPSPDVPVARRPGFWGRTLAWVAEEKERAQNRFSSPPFGEGVGGGGQRPQQDVHGSLLIPDWSAKKKRNPGPSRGTARHPRTNFPLAFVPPRPNTGLFTEDAKLLLFQTYSFRRAPSEPAGGKIQAPPVVPIHRVPPRPRSCGSCVFFFALAKKGGDIFQSPPQVFPKLSPDGEKAPGVLPIGQQKKNHAALDHLLGPKRGPIETVKKSAGLVFGKNE